MAPIALPNPPLHQAQDVLNADNVNGRSENFGAGRKTRLLSQRLYFHANIRLERITG
jgi:hypothetical protein